MHIQLCLITLPELWLFGCNKEFTYLLISHIIIISLAKAFAVGNVKSVWSVPTELGIIPVVVLYFMRSA